MRPHEEMYRGNSCQEQKTEKMKIISQWNCEAKICKSSSLQLTEKLNLPIIQPTVIQALPSAQRTLPSLQATEKRCPPNSPSKERKTMPKPKSAVRRILPSLPPKMEDLTLPGIQPSVVKKVASSTKQLPIRPTIEERILHIPQFPEAKIHARVKKVRQVLPSIPQTEARTPPSIPPTEKRFQPSIQPTTVKPLLKCRRVRQKPLLATLPTIEETSPSPAGETAVEKNSELAENEASLATKQEGTLSSLQQAHKPTLVSLQQGKKDKWLDREEELQNPKTRMKEPRQKPKKAAKATQTTVQPIEKEPLPGLKPIEKEDFHSSDRTMEQKRARPQKENGANHPKVKQTSSSPQTEAKKLSDLRPTRSKQLHSSEAKVEKKVSRPPTTREDDKADRLIDDELLSTVKRPQKSHHSEAKDEAPNFERRNREATVSRTESTVEQKLPRPAVERRAKTSLQMAEGGALPRLQATVTLIKTSRQSREKGEFSCLRKKEVPPASQSTLEHKLPRPPVTRRNTESDPWSEREVLQNRKHREREDVLSLHSKMNQTNGKLLFADSYVLLSRRWKESAAPLQSCQRREKDDKPRFQPKVNQTRTSLLTADSYALLSLKRKDFEAPQGLQRMAKRSQTKPQPSVKERNTRILTVKPALPSIQPTQESTVPKPPTAPRIKKGLPSARPHVKRAHPRIQATVSRPLPSIQPIVKQALPSLESSSLQKLVKKPLPSVQPEENCCPPATVEATMNSNLQSALVTETGRTPHGDAPSFERQ